MAVWYGFALPIPPLLAIVRLVLTALAWRGLTNSKGGSAKPSPAVCSHRVRADEVEFLEDSDVAAASRFSQVPRRSCG